MIGEKKESAYHVLLPRSEQGERGGGHKFVNILVTNTKNEPYFYAIYYVC